MLQDTCASVATPQFLLPPIGGMAAIPDRVMELTASPCPPLFIASDAQASVEAGVSGAFLIVDPIDGTTNFVHGMPVSFF